MRPPPSSFPIRLAGFAAALLLLLAGCAGPPPARGALDLAADGACLRGQLVRRTLVRDASTIDFEMKSGLVVRNRLPEPCPGLGPTRPFAYRVFRDRLCRGDLFTAAAVSGPVPGATCALGAFEPIGPRTGG